MTELSAVLIYWYISIGLLVGYASRFIFRDRGMRTLPSILTGALGAVSVGIISQIFNFGDTLIMGLIGSIGFVFICNIFRAHPDTGTADVESR